MSITNYLLPSTITLEDQLAELKNNAVVQELYRTHPGIDSAVISHLSAVRSEYARMRTMANAVDTLDKLLMPIDAIGDSTLLTGIGVWITGAKEAIELPLKTINSLYYAYRTKEYGVPGKDFTYELFSILIPFGILDLSNRYASRANEFILQETIKRVNTDANSKSS